MTYLLCRHVVRSFPEWKRELDGHADAQSAAGLRVERCLHCVDDPAIVFVLYAVTDLPRARAFFASPEAPEARIESGSLEVDGYFVD